MHYSYTLPAVRHLLQPQNAGMDVLRPLRVSAASATTAGMFLSAITQIKKICEYLKEEN